MSAPTTTSKRPHDSPFKQQKLKAWQPIFTPKCVISTFATIAVAFIAIGAAILVASDEVIDAGPFRYDDDGDNTTFVSFEWPESTSNPVYVYYQLSNFYQNHRRYVKSRSDVQLSGSSLKDKRTLGDCDPWETFADKVPDNIDELVPAPDPDDFEKYKLNPCGLIANSQFNDSFTLFKGVCDDQDACDSQPLVQWTKKGIAWSSDKEKKFKNLDGFDPDEPSLNQQKDVEDEEFIVWMRTSALPTFKKLNRIIKDGLPKGNYTMKIDQRFEVASFDGKKAFYLTTTTWIGGKNEFLGWAYVAVGILCFVIAILFLVKQIVSPRAMGAGSLND